MRTIPAASFVGFQVFHSKQLKSIFSYMSREKIGLALSGGGARGFAHIGVLRVLVENDIPIDMIAGTSAGSIVGAAFAAGMTIDQIAAMAAKVRWRSVVRPSLSPRGLFSTEPMRRFIQRELPVHNFDDLTVPFAAVACDLASGSEVVLKDSGDLMFALRASCSLPGLFAPVTRDGRLLVDGGVVSQLPVNAVLGMGADRVIAVDLMACGATFRSNPRTPIGSGRTI
jgi:NTE family protein